MEPVTRTLNCSLSPILPPPSLHLLCRRSCTAVAPRRCPPTSTRAYFPTFPLTGCVPFLISSPRASFSIGLPFGNVAMPTAVGPGNLSAAMFVRSRLILLHCCVVWMLWKVFACLTSVSCYICMLSCSSLLFGIVCRDGMFAGSLVYLRCL